MTLAQETMGEKWEARRVGEGVRFSFRQHELMYEYESKSEPVSVIGCFFFPVYWLLKWLELCVGRRDSRGEEVGREG